jgi:putative endonuclease
MYFVYILKSIRYKRFYIGYTNNLINRIKEHNSGLSAATKPYLPWQIVYYEAYRVGAEARHREHNLKLRSNAWNQLRRRISESLNAD